MKSTGIVCEYNPFHRGHAYLIDRIKGEGAVVCIMSGNFTQRGEASLFSPSVRASMALSAGADLVVELPFPYAAASAAYFAEAGVRGLAELGVTRLAFGSESGDISTLQAVVKNANFDKKCRNGVENKAIGDAAAYFDSIGFAPGSNDILALAYLGAIEKLGADMTPIAIKRQGGAYRQTTVETGTFASATALRERLRAGADIGEWVPASVRALLENAIGTYGMADTSRLGGAMIARLRGFSPKCAGTVCENHHFAECGGGLLERLIRVSYEVGDYEALIAAAATKRYTNARIRRALLFLLAGVRPDDLKVPPAYLRLLGANERGRAFLAQTEKIRTVPVITKQSEIAALGEAAERQRALAKVADGLFALCAEERISTAALQTARPVLF